MKRLRLAFIAAVLAFALPASAYAEHLSGGDGWTVAYTAEGSLTDNYSASEYADQVSSLQPGDDITLTVTLKHDNAQAGDWYIANEVLKSLESGTASGSAYDYVLTYTNPSGTARTLYDSMVGGTDSQGLVEASEALDGFVYLDELASGQQARVSLKVGLDGETEGNAYFDTLARLQMSFAVQPADQAATGSAGSNSANNGRMVQTGDDLDVFPLFVTMAVSGAVVLGFAIASLRMRKRDREEGAR